MNDNVKGSRKAADHWLVRPGTIRWLWIVSALVLAGLVGLDFVTHKHPHFDAEALPAFASWFGFGACVVLVLGSKLLGVLLKRPDDYYDD